MKKIKVIEYITNLGDGGAETIVKDYARLINKERFELVIVVTRDYGYSSNSTQIREAGIPIIYIYKHWNIFIRLWNKVCGLWYIPFVLRRIMRKEKADVLHVHLELLKYVRNVGKALNNVRLFYTCHSIIRKTFGEEYRAETQAAKYLIKKHGLRFIALQDEMKEELLDYFGEIKVDIVRNSIDFRKFLNATVTKEEERKELRIPEDAFVVGHVGRFNPVKNHLFLIEIFNEVKKMKENSYLLMVGNGDGIPTIDQLHEYGLSKSYMILSHRNDVEKILRAMDVFVFPSMYESFGIALLEAQAVGLKCVASDTIPKEVFVTNNAIALPLGDAKRWAEEILANDLNGKANGSLEDYDMNKEINYLEALYAGEES